MFSKLLKYEWKAHSGLLGILSLCALGAGLLGGGVLRGLMYMVEQVQKNEAAFLGITGLGSLLGFIGLALVAYGLAVEFILLFRFYKSRFTDEGYLTFTLPVKTEHVFLSSYVAILLWSLIAVAVIFVSVSLAILLGIGNHLEELLRELNGFADLIEDPMLDEPGYKCYTVLNALQVIVAFFYSLMVLMTGITLGCVLARKHKILASLGMCYGLNMAVGVVESVLTVVPMLLMQTNMDAFYVYGCWTLGISMVLQLALTIGGYLLSVHLMKEKLNLP